MKENKSPVISVIVPIHIKNEKIEEVRKSIHYATTPIEVVYVVEKNLSDVFTNLKNFEKIISIENKGRGFMLAEGVKHSSGFVIIFLHSDTILPKGWDKSIRDSLKDGSVVGGGFGLKFDVDSLYLSLAVKLLTFRANPLKILTGDRAIFVRNSLIKDNLSIFEVPIMEDLLLSKFMRKNGNVAILDANVITSANAFIKNGIFRQTIKILISYFRFRLGGNLRDIYNYYYSK